MNIAVVTPFEASNFGAFLQAYALKAHLEEHGHHVFHVRYRSERLRRRSFYRVRPGRRDLLSPLEYWRNLSFGREKYACFERDQTAFEVIEREDIGFCDVVLLGSDEIWNVRNRLFHDPIFFGHGLPNVIAYAPSMGGSMIGDYSDHRGRLDDIVHLRAIGARDSKTADLVESATSFRPPIVLDPTLLYRWGSVGPLSCGRQTDGPYLLVYAYNDRLVPIEELRQFARSRGLRLVSAGFRHSWCDESINCSPREFLGAVAGAQCVFTTTFHGTIFSIIFEKPFASNPISPKTVDLLDALELSSQSLCVPAEERVRKVASLLDATIDYTCVFKTIARMRGESESYLEQALNLGMESRS